MRQATLSLIAGFLVRIASERYACTDCMIKISSPRQPAVHLTLKRSQDLRGLKYPIDNFVDAVDTAATFICSAKPYFMRKSWMDDLLHFFLKKCSAPVTIILL